MLGSHRHFSECILHVRLEDYAMPPSSDDKLENFLKPCVSQLSGPVWFCISRHSVLLRSTPLALVSPLAKLPGARALVKEVAHHRQYVRAARRVVDAARRRGSYLFLVLAPSSAPILIIVIGVQNRPWNLVGMFHFNGSDGCWVRICVCTSIAIGRTASYHS